MRDRGRPRFKFEIISEGRISLAGETIEPFPVEVLDRTVLHRGKAARPRGPGPG